jgi:hypothetical protein
VLRRKVLPSNFKYNTPGQPMISLMSCPKMVFIPTIVLFSPTNICLPILSSGETNDHYNQFFFSFTVYFYLLLYYTTAPYRRAPRQIVYGVSNTRAYEMLAGKYFH